jgi:dipeptidase E
MHAELPMRLLLLSNSTNYGGTFLGHAGAALRDFLGAESGEALFVPYAAVRFPFGEFAQKVAERFEEFGWRIRPIHRAGDPRAAVEAAQAIVVGGGNTFQLIDRLHRGGLVEPIRSRVRAGAAYIGWSAGANIACPTIRTTDDMPIVEPPSFEALGLVPFQINPHYTAERIPNHGGETRVERLLEFVTANPGAHVIGLPEGTMLQVEDRGMQLLGEHPAVLLDTNGAQQEVVPGPFRLA